MIMSITLFYGKTFSEEELLNVLQRLDEEKFIQFRDLFDLKKEALRLHDLNQDEAADELFEQFENLEWDLDGEPLQICEESFLLVRFSRNEFIGIRNGEKPWILGVKTEIVDLRTGQCQIIERDFEHLNHIFSTYIDEESRPQKISIPGIVAR